jgi:hypothetical protein
VLWQAKSLWSSRRQTLPCRIMEELLVTRPESGLWQSASELFATTVGKIK